MQERGTVEATPGGGAQQRDPVPRYGDRWSGLLLAAGVVVAASIGAAVWVHFFARHLLEDAWVYLGAGRVVLAGGALYSAELATPIPGFRLGFTYPPLAAELFALGGGLPVRVGAAALTAMSGAALFLVCLLAVASSSVRTRAARPTAYPIPLIAAGATWLACTLEPVQQTFSFGQVNLVLAGLVAADCLVDRPWWPRGALVGLAAAIKLTPLAFLLFFLAARRYRAALVAAASFVLFGAVAWAIEPADSSTFWFHDVASTDRIGALWYAGNQSLRGLVARLGLPITGATVAWVVLAVLVVALGFLGTRQRLRSDDRLARWC
ncbi:MAG: DUF2029 domain-containing protein [Acidobacteria bacterium]|nr:DUF2029 domain-containing protein [Acidobacteriota bacterium]